MVVNRCLLQINPLVLESVTFEIVVWIFDTFGNNLEIKNYFAKYLKENWLLYTNEHLSFKYFPNCTFELNCQPKVSGCV